MKHIKSSLLLLLILALPTMLQGCFQSFYYRTTEVADYGVFKGCYDNDTVKEFVTAFFPEQIEDFFENVRYVFVGITPDQYGFEAYLEFQITDEAQFQKYVAEIANPDEFTPFFFDPAFVEYVISDSLSLNSPLDDDRFGDEEGKYDPEETRYCEQYSIDSARIQKVLVSEADNRIIYFAFGVTDGGGSNTVKLSTFFKRFNIAPKDYETYCKDLRAQAN